MTSLLLALLGITMASPIPPVGLSPNVTPQGGTEELIANLTWCKEQKLTLMHMAVHWNDMESEAGYAKVVSDLKGAADFGYTPIVTIETINTLRREVPADLATEPWDSPKMTERFSALLRKFCKEIPTGSTYMSLGNEVDPYLAQRPTEEAAYIKFLASAKKVIQETRPGLKVGVTTTFEGLRNREDQINRIQAGMDVFCQTYYLMGDAWRTRPISSVSSDVAASYKAAKGRPVYWQEIGCPSSEKVGSSEAHQAAFVDAVFDAVKPYEKQTLGLVFFLMVDFSPKMMDDLAKYYGMDGDGFREGLGTLGFRSPDGKDKRAMARLLARVKGS